VRRSEILFIARLKSEHKGEPGASITTHLKGENVYNAALRPSVLLSGARSAPLAAEGSVVIQRGADVAKPLQGLINIAIDMVASPCSYGVAQPSIEAAAGDFRQRRIGGSRQP